MRRRPDFVGRKGSPPRCPGAAKIGKVRQEKIQTEIGLGNGGRNAPGADQGMIRLKKGLDFLLPAIACESRPHHPPVASLGHGILDLDYRGMNVGVALLARQINGQEGSRIVPPIQPERDASRRHVQHAGLGLVFAWTQQATGGFQGASESGGRPPFRAGMIGFHRSSPKNQVGPTALDLLAL